MAVSSVVVYETKPATEWLLGEPVQKVSPKYAHASLQAELTLRLVPWARNSGRVGCEWRFWLQPPGEESRYLVPDVAYLSYERLARSSRADAEEPYIAPDAAFEILSPNDRAHLVAHKIDVYLRAGTSLVVVVDPGTRTIRTFDRDGERVADEGPFAHEAIPDLSFNIAEFFATLDA